MESHLAYRLYFTLEEILEGFFALLTGHPEHGGLDRTAAVARTQLAVDCTFYVHQCGCRCGISGPATLTTRLMAST